MEIPFRSSLAAALLLLVGPLAAEPAHALSVYWVEKFETSNTGYIYRANAGDPDPATNREQLVVESGGPHGIAVDPLGGKIYWSTTSSDEIRRADLDGSNVETLFSGFADGVDNARGIALDTINDKVYWASLSDDTLLRGNLDGSGATEVLFSGLDNPQGVALDVAAGKVYWTEFGSSGFGDVIRMGNLDGSGTPTTVIGIGAVHPRGILGLDLDLQNDELYWTESGGFLSGGNREKLRKADLDGTNAQDLVTSGMLQNFDIALDVPGGRVWWTSRDLDHIQSSTLSGGDVQTFFTADDTMDLFGIAVVPEPGILHLLAPAWLAYGASRLRRRGA